MPKLDILPINEIQQSPLSGQIKKVLIIKPSSLGDVVHTLPVIALLKQCLPDVEIDWLINKNISLILDYCDKYLNRKILFNRAGFKGVKFIEETYNLFSDIRKQKYDCIIDFQGLLRSAIMTFIGRGKYKVGFNRPKEKISRLAYNIKVDIPDNITHAIEKNIYLAAHFLQINPVVPDFTIPLISGKEEILAGIDIDVPFNFYRNQYFIIAPGARWNSKRWPVEFFAEVLDIIAEKNDIVPVIIGTKDEKILSDKIIEKSKVSKPLSCADKTNMPELIELLRNARFLLTNDSGPMHIAASLGTKVFALFGATDPNLTGPFWPNSHVFQNNGGCIKCFKRECPLDIQECQNGFSAESVAVEMLKCL